MTQDECNVVSGNPFPNCILSTETLGTETVVNTDESDTFPVCCAVVREANQLEVVSAVALPPQD